MEGKVLPQLLCDLFSLGPPIRDVGLLWREDIIFKVSPSQITNFNPNSTTSKLLVDSISPIRKNFSFMVSTNYC